MGFSQVYRRYFGFVWRLAYRLGVQAIDLEDVAQEVFIVVHRRLPGFEQRSRMETWLAAITRRVAWRHRRGRERARRKLDALQPVDRPDDGFSFERSAAIRSLDHFLQDLPREQREVFVLSELGGLGGPEIVEVTGMKLNTVYARIRTTRQRFDAWCSVVSADDRPAQVLARSRRDPRPPRDAAPRVWALLGLRLGAPATAASTTTLATSLKVFTLTLAVGSVGLGLVSAVLPPRPSPPAAPGARGPQPVERTASASASRSAATEPAAVAAPPPNAIPSPASPPPVAAPADATRAEPRPPVRSTPSPGEALAREHAIIASSRAAADRDPAQALAQLDAHEREFPNGVLGRERARLRVRALCRMQRLDEARAVAQASGDRALLARECSTRGQR
jgi:RNA polymerase sigma factor (sigma-70 family)